MTPRAALAVIGAISLFVLVTTTIVRALARHADDRRARYATRHLVGRTYWSPDMVLAPAMPVYPVLSRWLRSRGNAPTLAGPSRGLVFFFAAVLIAWTSFALAMTATAGASPPTSTSVEEPGHDDRCGEERAAVKLGKDRLAPLISLDVADTTIAELVAIRRPRRTPETERTAIAERQVWRVHGTIAAFKLEQDGDLHVVLSDGAGHHMIVEIPSGRCAVGGAWAKQIAAAREAAEAKLHPTGKLRRTAILDVTVTGLGFFDKLHGQVGAAPNGVELHPVLAIEIGGGS